MTSIDAISQEICELGALAVRRYVEVSGIDPTAAIPEHFIPAFILDRPGDKITTTMETNFGELAYWNAEAHKRRSIPRHEADERRSRLAQMLQGKRVDLVLYEGQEERKQKRRARIPSPHGGQERLD